MGHLLARFYVYKLLPLNMPTSAKETQANTTATKDLSKNDFSSAKTNSSTSKFPTSTLARTQLLLPAAAEAHENLGLLLAATGYVGIPSS